MPTDLFSGLNDRSKDFMERASQFNETLFQQFTKAADLQMEAMRRYADIASEQARRLAEVRNLDDLKELSATQTEVLKEISDQISSDWRAWQEYMAEASDELKFRSTDEEDDSQPSPAASSDSSGREDAA